MLFTGKVDYVQLKKKKVIFLLQVSLKSESHPGLSQTQGVIRSGSQQCRFKTEKLLHVIISVFCSWFFLCVCPQVLNDVVVDRGPSSYLSNVDLFLDGHLITTVQGDGEPCFHFLALRCVRASVEQNITLRAWGKVHFKHLVLMPGPACGRTFSSCALFDKALDK